MELHYIAEARYQRLLKENTDGRHNEKLRFYNFIKSQENDDDILLYIQHQRAETKLKNRLQSEFDNQINKVIEQVILKNFPEAKKV